jgi:hypothetical protein
MFHRAEAVSRGTLYRSAATRLARQSLWDATPAVGHFGTLWDVDLCGPVRPRALDPDLRLTAQMPA